MGGGGGSSGDREISGFLSDWVAEPAESCGRTNSGGAKNTLVLG